MNRVVKMAAGMALGVSGTLAVQAQEAELQVQAVDRGAGYFASNALIEPPFNSDSAVVHATVTHQFAEDTAAVYGASEPQPYWGYGGWFRGGYTGVEGWAVLPGTTGERFGVVGLAEGSPANYGVWGVGAGQSDAVAYGVFGEASCPAGTTNCVSYGVYADGDLAYTGELIAISDLRFKEAVEPLENALERVLELQVVSYEHRRDAGIEHLELPSGKQYGFVAQQVAEVLPDLVVDALHPAQRSRSGEKSSSPAVPYKALKITELLPFLVRAIQEQQAEIESLKAQIEPLRHRLADRSELASSDPPAGR